MPSASLALHQRAVFAHEQIEVRAFFIGEFEKDLLALGILEALAVLLEEAMRAALAADADEQRLLIVDAVDEPFAAFGEESVGGAFEEQEGRPRLELRVALQQLRVPFFERAEMMFLFRREVL